MRPSDLFLYLFGHRGAVGRIAGSRDSWAVGALLVITAGMARNYDHLYLPWQPEAFLGPFVASLFSTVFIFYWANAVLKFGKVGSLPRQQVTFLTLIWLTAPCAWLYAIPVESWTDLLTATKWNIAFLAVVSCWRVALITRAVAVLTGAHWLRCFAAILAPAALEMMVGSWFKSLSLIGIMGGVRLPPHHELLRTATEFTTTAALIVFLVALAATPFIKTRPVAVHPLLRPFTSVPRTGWLATFAILAAWIAAVFPVQSKLRNKFILQSHIDARRFAEAVQFASSRTRGDFPAAHFLPPDPYQRFRFETDFFLSIPATTPDWLKKEWRESALIGLKENWQLQPRDWADLQSHHFGVARELTAHAEYLRAKSELSFDERNWLDRFDHVVLEAKNLPAQQ